MRLGTEVVQQNGRRLEGIAISAKFRQEGKTKVREIEVVPLYQADNADGR